MILIFRMPCAGEQLRRYSSSVASEELMQALEQLTELNDDLWHRREKKLILEQIEKIKQLLDRVAEVECS